MARLTLAFLDTFQVTLDSQPITRFRSSKNRGLLVYLALQSDRPFPREVLATLFWPEESESNARNNLRQSLYQLRKVLGDLKSPDQPYLLVTRQTVQFNADSDFVLDANHFLQSIDRGELEAAVDVYYGDLLPGFTCDSLQFEDWLRHEREQLHHAALEAMFAVTEDHLQSGQLDQAQAVARRQLALEPWREPAYRQLMQAYALAGDRGSALAQYEVCREILWDELGVEPTAETVALYESIKVGDHGTIVAIPGDESGLAPRSGTAALHHQIAQGKWSPSGTCPNCNAPVEPSARFCARCGRSLDKTPSTEQNKPDRLAERPSSMVPTHLAKKVLHERQAISGERRTVTVLFIDAAGSTALGEQLDPEELYNLTQDVLHRMMEAVYMYEGHVAHFRGDGIMAIFGAPIAHEDSARRAVSAALEMQRSLAEFATTIEGRLGVKLSFRVGLNTGLVVVGHIGDDLTMEFTALGDTVNLAARMEGTAEPGTVYVARDTYRAVRDYFESELVGQLSLKGKQEPVQAYKVLKERAIRTRFEAATERGLTPYVGRQQDLDLLRHDLERVKDGRGQVVLISGEAGIGKSRLLLEFRRSAQDEVAWLEGQCISYGKHIPYRPIIDFVKDAFQIEESDSEVRIIQRVDEATASWNQAAHVAVPYLKALLSVDPGDPTLSRMEPRDRRAGIFDGLQALLLQKSDDRPLVVVVEDLHWADEQSEAVLKALVDFIATAKVLLILTYRLDYAHSLGTRSFFDHIALGDLSSRERLILAGSILQQATLPEEVATLITAKGEGNPFYIEEVTKSLVEIGVLQKEGGNYGLVQPVERVHVPDTIQEVILSRIDRLDAEAKAALQLASVIGRSFTARLLESISDLENELDMVLAKLKDLELIYQESRYPEPAYMFKHALTQDVAYQTLLRRQRKRLHRLIGMAIEELYADRLPEQFEMLAHHYYEGELWDEALVYLVKAGDKAAAAYANQDALDYYGRALEVCESLGSSVLETIAQVARRRGVVNLSIADFEAAIADFARVWDTARTLEDERLESMALFLRSLAEFEDHDPVATEESLRTALAIAGEQFADIRFVASSMLALALKTYNRHAEAKVAYEEAKKLAPKIDDPAKQFWWRIVEPLTLNWEGRFDEALAIHRRYDEDDAYTADLHISWNKALALGGKGEYQQALDLLKPLLASCERIGESYVRVRVLNTVGWIYGELQDHRQAMAWNKRGVQEAQEVGFSDPEVESNARLNLADNLMALGHLDEAREHLLFVEQIVRQPRPQDHFSLWRYSQHHFHSYGELWLIQGEPDKALAYADECLALAETSDSRKNIVKGRHLRGQAFLARRLLKEAERELAIALEVARQVGNPTQLWRTYEVIGALRTAEGRPDDAEGAYLEAATVVQRVADNLADYSLRETFLTSDAIQAIMVKAGKE